MRKISVFIKRPGESVIHTNISDSLENLQRTVGGPIETATFANNAVLICDENGRIDGSPFNCVVRGTPFFGPIIFAGVKGEEFADFPIKTMKEFNELGFIRDLY